MKIELIKSTVPQNYETRMLNQHGLTCDASHTLRSFTMMIDSLVATAAVNKSKADKTAVMLKDKNNNFLSAAIITKHKGDGEATDNYSVTFTFEEKDLEGCGYVVDLMDNYALATMVEEAMMSHNYSMKQNIWLVNMVTGMFQSLKHWGDSNVEETGVAELNLEGVFTFTTQVENGAKYYSLIPSETIKQRVKDDAANQQ